MLTVDDHFNSLVIELNRSFLQYVFEASPWATGHEAESDKIRNLALIQQQDVGVLCDVLVERNAVIDFGTYPTEYTSRQYNSLSSMVGWLMNSQSMIVERVTAAAAACSEDAFAVEVLNQIQTNESAVLEELTAVGTSLVA